ncbi:unnamed protein product [Cylindrotheca closterium]|uniref:G-protein coupled receptors family 3 profile domain-containing protein n=1 Tax=Cylindrotheca closterium TaxID=2856 RepID=A0AAD2PYA2_9STRA|nr:unnamed protein product [Cylindrotheca closterium]
MIVPTSSHCRLRRRALYFLILLITATTPIVNAQEAFIQVKLRVFEKVDRFLNFAVSANAVLADFYDLRGFPHDLGAKDRDTIAHQYLFSVVSALEATGLKPFYGLEDGTFLGYLHNDLNQVPKLVYREPGNSGFNNSDPVLGKYMNTCVNPLTGDSKKCLLTDASGTYVSCVNDCEYIPCPGNGNILCQNYDIVNYSSQAENAGDDDLELGYVPRSTYCINKNGDFSDAQGEILVESLDGVIRDGSCTFKDGSPVQRRNISGAFASCRDLYQEICLAAEAPGNVITDTTTTGPIVCDTTFAGAYDSTNYDPRWRGWYISSRETLVPRFSDPYIFFSLGVVGITYTFPIFMENKGFEKFFSGVLAIDMELDDVSNFLAESFVDTSFAVAIYEDEAPHNMIGISTQSDVISWWLIEDDTVPCPEDQIGQTPRVCLARQLNIMNFESSIDDSILRKAHEAFELVDFVEDVTVAVREDDDDVSTPSYIATTVLYDLQDANLKWRILVTTPIDTDPDNIIVVGDSMFPFIIAIAVLGFLICIGLFLAYYGRRNERAVQFSDVQFTSAFLLASALLNLSTLTLLGKTDDELCLMRMWVFFTFSSMMLSPLFVKAYRTYKLLGSSVASAMSVKMNNVQAWIRTLPIPAIQVLILFIFTFADPWIGKEDINLAAAIPTKDILCRSQTEGLMYAQAIYDSFLLSIGCILAYLTRNIDPRFGDAKALLFAMYNIAFTTIMIALVIGTIDTHESGKHVLQAIGVFWGTVFSSAAFVVPRLVEARRERRRLKKHNSKLRNTLEEKRKANRVSSHVSAVTYLHDQEDALKVLVCTGNLGNAEPTLNSMMSWIPEHGECSRITPLDGNDIDTDQFDLIVVGMQEAKWVVKNAAAVAEKPAEPRPTGRRNRRGSFLTFGSGFMQMDEARAKQDAFLAAVEGADVVQIRQLTQQILGDDYTNISQETRGQMRLFIWALKDVAPGIRDIKVTGVNTGVGNVLANKGGIVASMVFHDTRLTFLSAHLAAHEGDRYYNARCSNMFDILKGSKTFDLGNKHSIDTTISSHHMFVLGDLNFRTKFHDASTATHAEKFERASKLIEEQDWNGLYRYDELHKGVRLGEVLVDFDTLPCNFNPTFKVERTHGYDYKDQRIPSYTDRILFKSAPGLRTNLRPLGYEPCEDFITSDHKPIRGSFSIVPNDMIPNNTIEGRYRLEFKELECSELLDGEGGSCNPFVRFIWDSIGMKEEGMVKLDFWRRRHEFPTTSTKYKNPNPRWKRSYSLVTTTQEVRGDATLFVCVYDQNVGKSNSILGSLALNLQSVFKCKPGQTSKEMYYDKPLQRYGKPAGFIRFKIELSKLVG